MKLHKKGAFSMAVVVGASAALIISIYILQYFQSQLPPVLKLISPEIAIEIAATNENITDYKEDDFSSKYVYIQGDGRVYEADIITKDRGDYLGMAVSPITGKGHYVWQVASNTFEYDKLYFIDSLSAEILAISNSSYLS